MIRFLERSLHAAIVSAPKAKPDQAEREQSHAGRLGSSLRCRGRRENLSHRAPDVARESVAADFPVFPAPMVR